MQNKPQASASISQEVIKLYDEYTHAPLERRDFLRRLSTIAGSTAAAYAILPMLENNYANAQMIAPDDARLTVERVVFPSKNGPISAYMAVPKSATDKLPAVIVVHENRGLNPHIEDVARRAAAGGYIALAVDFLSPQGGTPKDEDKARDMFAKVPADVSTEIGLAALKFLKTHAKSTGKVGVVGFCWGGGVVNQMAVHAPDLGAGVAYYGMQAKPEDAAKIKAPLLLQYASMDERINAGIAAYEEALKAGKKTYTVAMYDGVNHAFHNDTNAARYNAEAAKLSWQRTMDFFAKHLA